MSPTLRSLALLPLSALMMTAAGSQKAFEANAAARQLFASHRFLGAFYSEDVATGRAIASVDTGGGAVGFPLSAAKLFLVASYLRHEAKVGSAPLPPISLVIAQGKDEAGRQLALRLRRALGSRVMLDDLALFGFPPCSAVRTNDCTTLSRSSTDHDWANALSLGEQNFRVTPKGLSNFLRLTTRAGGHAMLSPRAAARFRRALLETVESGTARGSGAPLVGLGSMGGKTGSTAVNGAKPYDGLFAGVIFDRSGAARYTVVTYVRRQGFGGGAAATLSAEFGATALRSADR